MSNSEVSCLICKQVYRQLGFHVKVHGIDIFEYRRLFPDAPTVSGERMDEYTSGKGSVVGAKTSESLRAFYRENPERRVYISRATREAASRRDCSLSAETRDEISKGVKRAYREDPTYRERVAKGVSVVVQEQLRTGTGMFSEEARRKQKLSSWGHPCSEERRRAISEANTGNQARLGATLSEKSRQTIREAQLEYWADPIYAHNTSVAQGRRPNGDELQLQFVLDKYFPGEWEYVGDGQVWVGGKNPDFVSVAGERRVIEVFGYYWHSDAGEEEERIAHFRGCGFACIVFWGYDVYDEDDVVERVKNFK